MGLTLTIMLFYRITKLLSDSARVFNCSVVVINCACVCVCAFAEVLQKDSCIRNACGGQTLPRTVSGCGLLRGGRLPGALPGGA